jgi:phosphotransferase system HPr (HPr) family protein
VGKHQAKVTVQKDGELHDAASILELLTLTATEGTALTFSAIGPDAAEVMRKLIALVGCTDDLPVAVAG